MKRIYFVLSLVCISNLLMSSEKSRGSSQRTQDFRHTRPSSHSSRRSSHSHNPPVQKITLELPGLPDNDHSRLELLTDEQKTSIIVRALASLTNAHERFAKANQQLAFTLQALVQKTVAPPPRRRRPRKNSGSNHERPRQQEVQHQARFPLPNGAPPNSLRPLGPLPPGEPPHHSAPYYHPSHIRQSYSQNGHNASRPVHLMPRGPNQLTLPNGQGPMHGQTMHHPPAQPYGPPR